MVEDGAFGELKMFFFERARSGYFIFLASSSRSAQPKSLILMHHGTGVFYERKAGEEAFYPPPLFISAYSEVRSLI